LNKPLKKLGCFRYGPGLGQSKIAGNEEHYHHETNYVKNIVHVSFSFLSLDRITMEPDTGMTQRNGKQEAPIFIARS
jgi:hypothetical protein